MILTKQDCLWYASLYVFVSFGIGYWIRKLVSIREATKRTHDGASRDNPALGVTEMSPPREEAPTNSKEREK